MSHANGIPNHGRGPRQSLRPREAMSSRSVRGAEPTAHPALSVRGCTYLTETVLKMMMAKDVAVAVATATATIIFRGRTLAMSCARRRDGRL